MADLYKKRFRGYLIDNHSPAPPAVTFGRLDIAEHASFFGTAGIDSLMVYCKDHWGYSYYDTVCGERHPALDRDWVAETVAELRKKGIEFNAYYSVEYDNTITGKHPDWAIRKADGEELRSASRNAKWRMACYMTGYRRYVLDQLTEIVSRYHPDSLFLDIFGKSLCYCPECRRIFGERYGYPLPETGEGLSGVSAEVLGFLDDCAEGFLDDVVSTVKAIDPGLAVTINFSSHYPKRIRDKLDYHFTEPWAGNWLSAAFARATGRFPQLGPGDVSSVYNYLPESVYVAAAAQIAAQGCRVFMYSEPQRPDGTLEREEARRIGAAYREVKKFEHLLGNRTIVADVGIVQSDDSVRVGTAGAVVAHAIARTRTPNRHVNAVLGAMKCCDFSKRTWTVVPEAELSSGMLASLRVIILPEVLVFGQGTWEKLETFMRAGGTVIASGESGLRKPDGTLAADYAFAASTGIHFTGLRNEYAVNHWGGYAGFNPDGFRAGIPDTTPPISSASIRFSSPVDPTAVFVEPAVILGPETWVNWGYPPPARRTGEPLIVRMDIGAGTFWYAGFDLFGFAAEDGAWVKGFLSAVLDLALPDPLVRLETANPGTVGFTAFRRGAEMIIHIVSMIPGMSGGDCPPIPAGQLVFGTDRPVTAREVYPEDRPLVSVGSERGARVDAGTVFIHKIILVQGLGD